MLEIFFFLVHAFFLDGSHLCRDPSLVSISLFQLLQDAVQGAKQVGDAFTSVHLSKRLSIGSKHTDQEELRQDGTHAADGDSAGLNRMLSNSGAEAAGSAANTADADERRSHAEGDDNLSDDELRQTDGPSDEVFLSAQSSVNDTPSSSKREE